MVYDKIGVRGGSLVVLSTKAVSMSAHFQNIARKVNTSCNAK
jgi:hypothetical protein